MRKIAIAFWKIIFTRENGGNCSRGLRAERKKAAKKSQIPLKKSQKCGKMFFV